MRSAACVVGFVAAFYGSAAGACGHCVEDKIAAVYDHAAISSAHARGHAVAFFAVTGTMVHGEPLRREIENSARNTPGVDKDSVRVSLELAALSFSFNPRRVSPAAAQRSIEKQLAGKKLSLLELKLLTAPAAKR